MLLLFFIWLAGAFTTLGLLNGISLAEKTEIEVEVKIVKCLQSWYAFGIIIGIMMAELGEKSEKKE